MKTNIELKKAILNSIENLTIHGLPNIFRKEHILIRLWWFLLTTISIYFSILFIRQTLFEYFNYNVITEIRFNEAEIVEFPVITICNINKLSTDYSLKYLKRQLSYDAEFNFDYVQLDDLKYNLVNSFAKDLLGHLPLNEKQKYSKSNEMVKKCKFIKKKCSANDFEWLFNAKYGNCIQFNTNSSFHVNKTKLDGTMINSFYIELDVSLPNEIDEYGFQKGIYLSIDDKHTNPFNDFDDVLMIRPGLETSILIEKSKFIRHPKPYSKCDFKFDDIDTISYFKKEFKYFKQVFDANYFYSQSTCIYYCVLDFYFQACNCSTHESSIKMSNINFCKFNGSNNCLTSNQFNREYHKYCQSVCPLECNKVKYFSSISNSKIDTKLNSEDMIYLNIYFGSMSYIEYNEIPSITLFGLVSNLGGTLGIFLGKN
jgi:hypothetical protein